MHNDERKTRSDAIAHYLNEEELFLDIYRLGDFAEIVDEQTANHRIILLVDNKRGFSYPIVMPMAEQKDPTDLDIVLFMNKMKDERASFYAAKSSATSLPVHLFNNNESIDCSRISDFLPALMQIAEQ